MKKTFVEQENIELRKANIHHSFHFLENRSLLFSLIFVLMVSMGLLGFLANSPSLQIKTSAINPSVSDSAVFNEVASQDLMCLEIESTDQLIQKEALQEENDTIKEESESISEKVLGALMDNLESKKLASRSPNIDSFIKEAQNLLDLQRKVNNFINSEDYGLIDIKEYETALANRLTYIPTLRPIPGNFPGFGWRIHPIYKTRQFHGAADQGAPYGTPVKAAASGYVIASSYNSSSGYYITINHGNGFVTSYLHHSQNIAKAGQWVKQGDIIAKVGSTGTSTGSHLHFAVVFNGTPIDPRRILMQ